MSAVINGVSDLAHSPKQCRKAQATAVNAQAFGSLFKPGFPSSRRKPTAKPAHFTVVAPGMPPASNRISRSAWAERVNVCATAAEPSQESPVAGAWSRRADRQGDTTASRCSQRESQLSSFMISEQKKSSRQISIARSSSLSAASSRRQGR